MTVESSEVTFAVASDIGYEKQTKMLVESICEQMPESNIVSFISEDAKNKMDDTYIEYFDKQTDLYIGKTPRSDYPLTNLTQSFILACEKYDSEFYVQLDSDTLLLNKLQLPDEVGSELLAKPTNLGSHYWASEESAEEWHQIYDLFDCSFPKRRLEGTFDGKEGLPVWNAGVIATKDPDFPEMWLDATVKILESNILGEECFYAEQLSLSVLATQRYEIEPLSVKQNYAQEYITVPSDVQLLHYGDPHFLPLFIAKPRTYKKINKHYNKNLPSTSTVLSRVLNIARGRARRHISRDKRLKFEDLSAKGLEIFPRKIQSTIKSIYG